MRWKLEEEAMICATARPPCSRPGTGGRTGWRERSPWRVDRLERDANVEDKVAQGTPQRAQQLTRAMITTIREKMPTHR